MDSPLPSHVPAPDDFAPISISLDGEWALDYFPQPDSGPVRSLDAIPPHGTTTAQVPGCCELDLCRAGLLPEPEVGLAALRWRAFECHQWLYTRRFEAPQIPAGGRVSLRFEGIDTLADIFLNGEKIGETENMLVERAFDVTTRLRPGENVVQVLIRSAFLSAREFTAAAHGFHDGTADRSRLRKAAYMGGWDIFPRLFVSGIWRSVSLLVEGPFRVVNPAWVFGNFERSVDGTNSCQARAFFKVEAPGATYLDGSAALKLSIRPVAGGAPVATATRKLALVHSCVELQASGFDLWWPAGAGEHPLYEAEIAVVDAASGRILARDSRRVGFRTIELEREDWRSPEQPGKFLFRVNGKPIWMRGSNWVPTDAIPCRQAARIPETLAIAEELHCNMLRVWGGGVYEPDSFYDWCDEHGVLVWQDFMTGCAQTPQDDAYAAVTDAETRSVVLRLRNHPCLALWAGNNENDESIEWCRMRGLASPGHNGDRTSRETIARALRELDPWRPYLPSSPYFSPDVEAGRAKPSERHLWGKRDWYKTPFYVDSPASFASETGWHGCQSVPSLERMMSPDCIDPWTNPTEPDHSKLDWNAEWRLKASNPLLDANSPLWQRNDLMTSQTARMFGAAARDLPNFAAQSQFFQAEALKTMIETFRARKWTRTGGLLWWNLRDGWPQISDAVVDWFGGRKAAAATLEKAQRDVLAFALDDSSAWIVNDLQRQVTVEASWRLRGGAELLRGRWEISADASVCVGEMALPERGIIDIVWTVDGGAPQTNHYLIGREPHDWAWAVDALVPRTPTGAYDVPGLVVPGYGIASGKSGDPRFIGGTLRMQAPYFAKKGLDLSSFRLGTINVDVSPLGFMPGPDALTLRDVKWHDEMPAETFSFARATLVHKGSRYPALVYWPHPETKPAGFRAKWWIAEVIAPNVADLHYGDSVRLEAEPGQALWKPGRD